MHIYNVPGNIQMEFLGQTITLGEMWYGSTWPYADAVQGIYSATGDAFVDTFTMDLRWEYPAPRSWYSFVSNGKPFYIIKWFQQKYPNGLPRSNVYHFFNEDGEMLQPISSSDRSKVGLTLTMQFRGSKCYFLGFDGWVDQYPSTEWIYDNRIGAQNSCLGYYGADIDNLNSDDMNAATLWFYKPQLKYLPDLTNGVYAHTVAPGPVDDRYKMFLNGLIVNKAKVDAGDTYNNMFAINAARVIDVQFPTNSFDTPYYKAPSIIDYGGYNYWGNPLAVGSATDFSGLYETYNNGSEFVWMDSSKLPSGEVIIVPDDFEDYNNDPDPEADPDEPDETGGHGDYKPSDESIPPDEMDIPPSIISNSGCAHLYLPTMAQTQSFYQELWDQDIIDYLKNMFTNNPLDAVISLAAFPMDFDSLGYRSANPVKCVVGTREMDTTMFYANEDFPGIDFGYIYLRERWGSAIDYEPFTRIQIYLPFIGFVDVSPNDCYVSEQAIKDAEKQGKSIPSRVGYIHLRYMINLFTGDCVAYVFGYGNSLHESLIGTYTGVCGMQIPITGRDYNSFFSSIAGGLVRSVGSAMSGNIGAAAGDLVTTAISATGGAPIQRSGSFTAGTSLIGELEPFVLRTTPQQDLPNFNGYKKVAGLPYNKYVSLQNQHGYIEIEDIKTTGFTGTESELVELKSLMEGGIYL